ncbi:hypothetical protein D9M71_697890 [compost metagenome]
MDDLQRRLAGQLAAQAVELEAGQPQSVGEGLHRQVFPVVLLDQPDEVAQQLPVALVLAARRDALLVLPADPDHQQVDQRMQKKVAGGRTAFVFPLQDAEQGVDVAAVGPHRIAAG